MALKVFDFDRSGQGVQSVETLAVEFPYRGAKISVSGRIASCPEGAVCVFWSEDEQSDFSGSFEPDPRCGAEGIREAMRLIDLAHDLLELGYTQPQG